MNFYPTESRAISYTLCALLKELGCNAMVGPTGVHHNDALKNCGDVYELAALVEEATGPRHYCLDKPEDVELSDGQVDLEKMAKMLRFLGIKSVIATVDDKKVLRAHMVRGHLLSLIRIIEDN